MRGTGESVPKGNADRGQLKQHVHPLFRYVYGGGEGPRGSGLSSDATRDSRQVQKGSLNSTLRKSRAPSVSQDRELSPVPGTLPPASLPRRETLHGEI